MSRLGQPALEFTLPRDQGAEITLSALRPKNVVLYFYPRDDTPGCTTEALDFTAALADFEAANTVIIGISKDSVTKHNNFIKKHDLGVILASDKDGQTCEDYGVWVEKKMYGKTFLGIERATFLIDGQGVVRREWRKVKVPGHVNEVLGAARDL